VSGDHDALRVAFERDEPLTDEERAEVDAFYAVARFCKSLGFSTEQALRHARLTRGDE
jgi:hypothetical protein